MPTYPCKGSAGPAVTPTVWMSPLADKLTMGINLSIIQQTFGGGTFIPTAGTAVTATLLANQMVPLRASFGASTTAPDGTTGGTAQHITEDSTSGNTHLIESSLLTGYFTFPNCYMAGIYKAAERTRIAFGIYDDNGNGTATGFDLAGGQIAYTNATVGFGNSTISILSQDITSLGAIGGGGWYLCRILWNNTDGNVNFRILGNTVFLDNGSGTNSASLTYTGNGSSGVYGWKMSTLPPQAWAMAGNTVFFDDFNDPTLANIDLNNTFPDGKDWYLTAFVPGYLASQPLTSANLAQSGSTLTINPQAISAPYTFTASLSSWGNPGDGRAHGAVGRNVYVPPAYFEVKMQYPFLSRQQSEISISFFQTVEFCDELSRSAHVSGGTPYVQGDGSIRNWNIGGWAPTWGDFNGGSGVFVPQGISQTQFITQINTAPYTTSSSYDTGVAGSRQMWGLPQYSASHDSLFGYFGTPSYYVPLAQFYYNTTSETNTVPPGGNWIAYTYPINPATVSAPWNQPAIFNDQTTFHVYAAMIVPYDRIGKNHGCYITWVDGICTSIGEVHSPASGGDPIGHTTDWQRLFWEIQTGYNAPTWGWTLDYVKVVQ